MTTDTKPLAEEAAIDAFIEAEGQIAPITQWDRERARKLLAAALPHLSAPAPIHGDVTEEEVKWLGPYKTAAEALDECRRAVAEEIGADPETWPDHGNAPLAIAATVALGRVRRARPPVEPATVELVERLLNLADPSAEAMADDKRLTLLIHAATDAAKALSLPADDRIAELERERDEARRMSSAHREHAQTAVENSASLNRLLSIAEARVDAAEAELAKLKAVAALLPDRAAAIRALINKDAGGDRG